MRKPAVSPGRASNPWRATGEEVRRKLTCRAALMLMDHVKTYTISILPAGAGFRALCLGVPGCEVTAGTREEALERIEDQIKAQIADAAVRGKPVPVDRTSTKFLWVKVDDFLI